MYNTVDFLLNRSSSGATFLQIIVLSVLMMFALYLVYREIYRDKNICKQKPIITTVYKTDKKYSCNNNPDNKPAA